MFAEASPDQAGLASPDRKSMDAISEGESFQIAVMAASGDSPAALRATSMAFSAEGAATLKNLNVGGPANGAPRHGLPSVVVPEIDNWTTQPAAELFVMIQTMRGVVAYSKESRGRNPVHP